MNDSFLIINNKFIGWYYFQFFIRSFYLLLVFIFMENTKVLNIILTLNSVQVSDFYKRSNVESPAKAALEESSHMFENHGVQMLGQIRHGSCRPRAILFKVLADTVGLESRLMMVSSDFLGCFRFSGMH